MDRAFAVERVALHLVDRKEDQPQLGTAEIDLTGYKPDDLKAVQRFFAGHLENVWDAPEGRRTFAACFQGKVMETHYCAIASDESTFFERSCQIAQRLHHISKSVSASRGLLMVLWVRVEGQDRKYLGLYKMDPGRAERIIVPEDEAGELLLQLAVQRIERALPDPRDRVLKWAVIPHPIRGQFDVKARDAQGSADPAQYFVDFLDCRLVPSKKAQMAGFLRTLTAYADRWHGDEPWESRVEELLDELQKQDVITPEVVTATIDKEKTFEDFQPDPFLEQLQQNNARELAVPGRELRAIEVEYELDNGITIRGPLAVMKSKVEITGQKPRYEFRIETTGYLESYV